MHVIYSFATVAHCLSICVFHTHRVCCCFLPQKSHFPSDASRSLSLFVVLWQLDGYLLQARSFDQWGDTKKHADHIQDIDQLLDAVNKAESKAQAMHDQEGENTNVFVIHSNILLMLPGVGSLAGICDSIASSARTPSFGMCSMRMKKKPP